VGIALRGAVLRLIRTSGRGNEAEVEIEGQRLRVLDALSPSDAALAPGELDEAALEVVTIGALTEAIDDGREHLPGFERQQGWRYRAIGEIVSREPLAVDFGSVAIELALAPRDDWQPGTKLAVAIDRILLVPTPGERIRRRGAS